MVPGPKALAAERISGRRRMLTAGLGALALGSTAFLAPPKAMAAYNPNILEYPVNAINEGATGNGSTDDTTACLAAISLAESSGRALYLPAGNYLVSALLPITGKIHIIGAGDQQTRIFCTANFTTILSYTTTAAGAYVENLTLESTGTTTQLIRFAQGSQVLDFFRCQFTGNLSNDLLYSQAAGYVEFLDCTWNCNNANTNGLALDGFNQNTTITRSHAGGVGSWLKIENSTGIPGDAVQGTRIIGSTSICTGANPIQVGGGAFLTQLVGNIFDQSSGNGIQLGGGATLTQIEDNWIGMGIGATGACILVTSATGAGTQINGNITFGGVNAINIQASASARVAGVVICENIFTSAATTTIAMDSVNGAIVENNTDLSTPTNGSWATVGTNAAGGAYTFGGNSWYSTAPANFHSTSSYRADFDRGGILLKNQGTASTTGGTTITFAHGLISTPDQVFITQQGGPSLNSQVLGSNASVSVISMSAPATVSFSWQASVNR